MRYLINPNDITNFQRSQDDLEAFWLFCIVVAGKNSQVQAQKLAKFLEPAHVAGLSPFEYIEHVSDLETLLREVKMGQYNRLTQAFKESAYMDVSVANLPRLESIFGVGPKTSRFFILHSRPNQRFAVLDTHILRWMRQQGIVAPKATPTGTRYLKLEQKFLDYCDACNMSPAELDLHIWKQGAKA